MFSSYFCRIALVGKRHTSTLEQQKDCGPLEIFVGIALLYTSLVIANSFR